ncbi:hypothetical protein FKM82_017699 [Ascaphus truei]
MTQASFLCGSGTQLNKQRMYDITCFHCYFFKEKDLLGERIQEGVELNRVNSNMNHADEDNSSSSNSERWAVSTMYESYPFDYFAMKTSEHQDNTEACSAPNLPES